MMMIVIVNITNDNNIVVIIMSFSHFIPVSNFLVKFQIKIILFIIIIIIIHFQKFPFVRREFADIHNHNSRYS